MPATTAAPDELYPLAEAAERLRVAPHTLRHWCLSGRVSYCRIGSQLMLLGSDLQHFIHSNRTPAK
jgi:predicted site-specific integrase-resolvase